MAPAWTASCSLAVCVRASGADLRRASLEELIEDFSGSGMWQANITSDICLWCWWPGRGGSHGYQFVSHLSPSHPIHLHTTHPCWGRLSSQVALLHLTLLEEDVRLWGQGPVWSVQKRLHQSSPSSPSDCSGYDGSYSRTRRHQAERHCPFTLCFAGAPRAPVEPHLPKLGERGKCPSPTRWQQLQVTSVTHRAWSGSRPHALSTPITHTTHVISTEDSLCWVLWLPPSYRQENWQVEKFRKLSLAH